jgi:hypothetical protein
VIYPLSIFAKNINKNMTIHPNFIRFTAICGFITVLTTLGIHVFFPNTPTDFEVRVRLFQDSTYLFNR